MTRLIGILGCWVAYSHISPFSFCQSFYRLLMESFFFLHKTSGASSIKNPYRFFWLLSISLSRFSFHCYTNRISIFYLLLPVFIFAYFQVICMFWYVDFHHWEFYMPDNLNCYFSKSTWRIFDCTRSKSVFPLTKAFQNLFGCIIILIEMKYVSICLFKRC